MILLAILVILFLIYKQMKSADSETECRGNRHEGSNGRPHGRRKNRN